MKKLLVGSIALLALGACHHAQTYAQQCNPNVEQCAGYQNGGYQNGGHGDGAVAGAAILGAGAGALAMHHFGNHNNGYHQGYYPQQPQTVVVHHVYHTAPSYAPSGPTYSRPAASSAPSFAQVYRQNRPPRSSR